MTVDEAFKKAHPNMPETYPLYHVLKSYFAKGLEVGKEIERSAPRRKWAPRSGDRAPSNFPTGPLSIEV